MARGTGPLLADDPLSVQFLLEQAHRAHNAVTAEDVPNPVRFGGNDNELAIANLISERRHAAHPNSFLLRGGNLVANALAGDLTLELSKGQQHVQGQPTHRGRRIE